MNEDLRNWFGKGKKGGVGGGGWDRYNSSGDRVGKCGDAKEGDPYSACLSKEKARKLGKSGRASFVRRKRAAQAKGGDAKKGGERSKGQAPIKVKTSTKKENLDPKTFKDTGKSAPYGSGYSKVKELEERLNLFLEKNVPTNPSKWSYYKSQAKKKFDVYPSAYANAWAAKMYKKAGGKWKTSESLKLESNLLKVSKPYEFQPGDSVRNIDPKCKYYKSTGDVVAIHPNGDITYKINSLGATFTPPDLSVIKAADKLIRTMTRTPIPAYSLTTESKLNECVVARIKVEGKTILAKNRDRGYKAQIEVVHELIEGVEVVYLHDKLTDWSEGMNEFGVGIVNASLQVDFDEKEGDLAKANLDKGKAPKVSHDGLKIRTALSKKKLSQSIQSVVSFVGEDDKDVGVKGQTIIANSKYAFVVEMTSKHLPVIDRIDNETVTVRTNHGIEYPDTGYTKGVKRDSSLSRKKIAEKELSKVTKPNEVLDTLSKEHTDDKFMNPYRRKNKFDMETTSQVMYNLNDLEFHLRWDVDHSEYKGLINRLPKGYKPKIKIFISETD